MATPSLRDRVHGCLLGLAVGDAVGAPLEGMSSTDIYYAIGLVRDFVANPSVSPLTYTDDTEMMISVAEALVEHNQIEDSLIDRFAANYDAGRGYGAGTRRVLECAREGGDWKTLVQTQFKGGSFGNGAAMRVAPVGLLFHRDLSLLQVQAARLSEPTHTHPLAIDGARLLSLAIAYTMTHAEIDRAALFQFLAPFAQTEEFRSQMDRAATMRADASLREFGSSLPAHQSVTTAIACFALNPSSYPATISTAISLGDDTDTVAAMAGALSGAWLGINAIPHRLLDDLEDRRRGRSYIAQLADQLFDKLEIGQIDSPKRSQQSQRNS